MGTPVTITPMSGGRLMTNVSAEKPGLMDYQAKRDFRRDLDREIRREGHDYFWPLPSHLMGSQPFPQNQGEYPGTSPITLVHEACRADGERAVIVGTETDLYVFYPGLKNQAYVETPASPDDQYLQPPVVPYPDPVDPSVDLVPPATDYPADPVDPNDPTGGGGGGTGTGGGGTVDPGGGGPVTPPTPPDEHTPSDDFPEGTMLPSDTPIDPLLQLYSAEAAAAYVLLPKSAESGIMTWEDLPEHYRKYAMQILAEQINEVVTTEEAVGYTYVGSLEPVWTYHSFLTVPKRSLGAEADGASVPSYEYIPYGWSVTAVLQFQKDGNPKTQDDPIPL